MVWKLQKLGEGRGHVTGDNDDDDDDDDVLGSTLYEELRICGTITYRVFLVAAFTQRPYGAPSSREG
ncbi:hypothetical protein MMC25_007258 [Agyrium rufum]|nr:hypothetical protein [Agyrium rufum]